MDRVPFEQFTPAQARAAAKFLADFPDPIRRRGEKLARQGAVQEVWWNDEDQELEAEVQGSELYETAIYLEAGPDYGDCSCPYEDNCKHMAALLIVALGARDGQAAVKLRPAKPKAPPAPKAGSLAAHLQTLLGRRLARGDEQRADGIEKWFRSSNGVISERKLADLTNHRFEYVYWSPQDVTVWPRSRPPKTAVEAWLYLAHALREKGSIPASGVFQKVPWDEVDRLVAPWVREQAIERWREVLAGIAEGTDHEAVAARFRLRLEERGAFIEWSPGGGDGSFKPVPALELRRLAEGAATGYTRSDAILDRAALRFLAEVTHWPNSTANFLPKDSPALAAALGSLLRLAGFEGDVVAPDGTPLARDERPLRWSMTGPHHDPATGAADYALSLRLPDGEAPPPPLVVLPGRPALYVTTERVFPLAGAVLPPADAALLPVRIPAPALESTAGLGALARMGLEPPAPVAARVVTVPVGVTVRCRLFRPEYAKSDYLRVSAETDPAGRAPVEQWNGTGWSQPANPRPLPPAPPGEITRLDRSAPAAALPWLAEASLRSAWTPDRQRLWFERRVGGANARNFPEEFVAWLDRRPDGVTVELDPELASLRDGKVSGTVSIDAEESGIDWFDLRVALQVSDTTLTPDEVELLLKAAGRWVRLPGKGWRRLDLQFSDEEQRQLADLGLGPGDLAAGEKQRLHVLQLAGAAGGALLPKERVEELRRRAQELRLEIAPEVPAALTAELRPYQREGFHFLAYLSANRFGGILADDMGLGKTVQALAWLAWLRETGALGGPALVVCPKSVQDNWRAEAAKFLPSLPVRVWTRETAGELSAADDGLLVINYAQLRLHSKALLARPWGAAILDEAQAIKNPDSQTARTACALRATHRLALSGTPVENRLLDLWSILAFAMPGALGTRAAFGRSFGAKDDPLARRRLAARVRPFVLRRTKREVAKDLPDRVEEDLACELEGAQAALYRAELKRARALLLKASTDRQLDALRFNILTSLLRLRQICCHGRLVGAGEASDDSAKLAALLELLEPLMEEGHKVLVFSQFVGMLEIIQARLIERGWAHSMLTGQTEERGALVEEFQAAEGARVFLVSLKAGGFGLNLTAASYVVLFDPWWNPAVENQAIDRTHRIGQVNKVIAYRLIVRDSIEEKIRALQRQKSALASDILGEESFAKALTLDDFRFLLGE